GQRKTQQQTEQNDHAIANAHGLLVQVGIFLFPAARGQAETDFERAGVDQEKKNEKNTRVVDDPNHGETFMRMASVSNFKAATIGFFPSQGHAGGRSYENETAERCAPPFRFGSD